MKLKNWYTAKEMSKICKVSTRTIERRRNKLIEEQPFLHWFRMNRKPYKYNYEFMSEFTSSELFELIKINRRLSNTIECMHRHDTLEQHLSFVDWDYFITVTYKEPTKPIECRTYMRKIYEELKIQSTGDTRMFYTTETFSFDKGNHNHIVLQSHLKLYQVRNLIEEFEPIGIIDVQKYDYEQAGIFYNCKEWKNNEGGLHWDILGNKLEADGNKIMKIKNASNL